MVTGFMNTIRDRGSVFFGTRNKMDSESNHSPDSAATPTQGAGIITGLREGGFGFIARDGLGGGSDLYFHRSSVEGDGFAALREGQAVIFSEEPDPHDRNRQRAVDVRAAGGSDEAATDATAPIDHTA
jgi:cold shock CspA family protein